MKFGDIPRMSQANYRVDVPWDNLKRHLELFGEGSTLDFDPPYQRGYVWSEAQKTAYLEFRLKGGMSGGDIFWNAPGWYSGKDEVIELVDGKQRLQTVLGFLNGEIRAFGLLYHEFEGEPDHVRHRFKFHVNDMADPVAVVQWYLDMNTGGSIHTEKDLEPAHQRLRELEAKQGRSTKSDAV